MDELFSEELQFCSPESFLKPIAPNNFDEFYPVYQISRSVTTKEY